MLPEDGVRQFNNLRWIGAPITKGAMMMTSHHRPYPDGCRLDADLIATLLDRLVALRSIATSSRASSATFQAIVSSKDLIAY